jgi:hypothetical protein
MTSFMAYLHCDCHRRRPLPAGAGYLSADRVVVRAGVFFGPGFGPRARGRGAGEAVRLRG